MDKVKQTKIRGQAVCGHFSRKTSNLTRIFHTDHDEEDAKADVARQASILTQGCMSRYCPSQNRSLTQHPSDLPASAVDWYEICGLTQRPSDFPTSAANCYEISE